MKNISKQLKEEIARLKKIMNLNESNKYEYGCAMLYFDFPEMTEIQKIIDQNDLYQENGYGLETEPHTTLLYGLHKEVPTQDVVNVFNKHSFGECRVHTPSLFENELFDVLKFDVDGDSLHDCNKSLREFPHTNNYPDYHPHMTIGYLKPGMGRKYVDKISSFQRNLTPIHGVYSTPSGEKIKIKI